MDIYKGRPVITAEDYPQLIAEVLRRSIVYANSGDLTVNDRDRWRKTATDSYESVEEVLCEDRVELKSGQDSVVLYMTPSQLEDAVSVHGLWLLSKEQYDEDKSCAIESLLGKISRLTA